MKTRVATEASDHVLRLLRMLPPRDRLRVVAEVLPELEDDLPVTSISPSFWQAVDIQVLAEQQGAQPVADLNSFLGGWSEDEPIDGFLAALDDWRQESLDRASDP